jgi:hypothetical protein
MPQFFSTSDTLKSKDDGLTAVAKWKFSHLVVDKETPLYKRGSCKECLPSSVSEPHHFDADPVPAPAPGKWCDSGSAFDPFTMASIVQNLRIDACMLIWLASGSSKGNDAAPCVSGSATLVASTPSGKLFSTFSYILNPYVLNCQESDHS